jgi:hypothetical protein
MRPHRKQVGPGQIPAPTSTQGKGAGLDFREYAALLLPESKRDDTVGPLFPAFPFGFVPFPDSRIRRRAPAAQFRPLRRPPQSPIAGPEPGLGVERACTTLGRWGAGGEVKRGDRPPPPKPPVGTERGLSPGGAGALGPCRRAGAAVAATPAPFPDVGEARCCKLHGYPVSAGE